MPEKGFNIAEGVLFRGEAGVQPAEFKCTRELSEEGARGKGELFHNLLPRGKDVVPECPYGHGNVQGPVLAPSAEMGLSGAVLPGEKEQGIHERRSPCLEQGCSPFGVRNFQGKAPVPGQLRSLRGCAGGPFPGEKSFFRP